LELRQTANLRSCEEHGVYGSVLEENAVVRIRHVQILVDGSEALIVVMSDFFSVPFEALEGE
jgi:hypothetical protein